VVHAPFESFHCVAVCCVPLFVADCARTAGTSIEKTEFIALMLMLVSIFVDTKNPLTNTANITNTLNVFLKIHIKRKILHALNHIFIFFASIF